MNGHSKGHLCEPDIDLDEYKTHPEWNICPDGRCTKPRKTGWKKRPDKDQILKTILIRDCWMSQWWWQNKECFFFQFITHIYDATAEHCSDGISSLMPSPHYSHRGLQKQPTVWSWRSGGGVRGPDIHKSLVQPQNPRIVCCVKVGDWSFLRSHQRVNLSAHTDLSWCLRIISSAV